MSSYALSSAMWQRLNKSLHLTRGADAPLAGELVRYAALD